MWKGASAKGDSINYWSYQLSHCFAKISEYQMELNRKHCPCERAGIVVVNNRRASAVAVQTNCSKSKMEWRVNHAPEPKAVKLPRCSTLAAQVPVRQAVTVYFDSSSNSLLLHNHHFSCHSIIHRRHIRSKLQAISFISTT